MKFKFFKKHLVVATLLAAVALIPVFTNAKDRFQDKPLTIYHAFQMEYDGNYLKDLTKRIKDLNAQGYDAVQIMPPQESKDNYVQGKNYNPQLKQEWWNRYQPYNFYKIGGLGTYKELKALTAEAAKYNMMIISDVVFNHTMTIASNKEFRDAYSTCGGVVAGNTANCAKRRALENKLDALPNFTKSDFHNYCTISGGDYSNYSNQHDVRYCWGGSEGDNDQAWPDLRTDTDAVRNVGKKHLDLLVKAGVRGFRFDAIKHMEPADYKVYSDYIDSKNLKTWVYGEVYDTTLPLIYEYSWISAVTDFVMKNSLESAFSYGGYIANLRTLINPNDANKHGMVPDEASVVFARNHDTLGSIPNQQDRAIAWAYLLGRQGGTPLILSFDANEPVVKNAVLFRKHMADKKAPKEFYLYGSYISNPDDKNLLFMTRGAEGFSIINKAGNWFVSKNNDFTLTQLEGCYENTNANDNAHYTVAVERDKSNKKHITRWGTPQEKEFKVGPQTALFFERTAWEKCQ